MQKSDLNTPCNTPCIYIVGEVITEILSYRALCPPPYILDNIFATFLYLLSNIMKQMLLYKYYHTEHSSPPYILDNIFCHFSIPVIKYHQTNNVVQILSFRALCPPYIFDNIFATILPALNT